MTVVCRHLIFLLPPLPPSNSWTLVSSMASSLDRRCVPNVAVPTSQPRKQPKLKRMGYFGGAARVAMTRLSELGPSLRDPSSLCERFGPFSADGAWVFLGIKLWMMLTCRIKPSIAESRFFNKWCSKITPGSNCQGKLPYFGTATITFLAASTALWELMKCALAGARRGFMGTKCVPWLMLLGH